MEMLVVFEVLAINVLIGMKFIVLGVIVIDLNFLLPISLSVGVSSDAVVDLSSNVLADVMSDILSSIGIEVLTGVTANTFALIFRTLSTLEEFGR